MKPGLYENIRKKKARIKAQKASGAKKVERMRKPGSEGAPSAEDFKNAAKTAKDGEDDKKDKLVGPLKERLQMLKDKKKSKGERRMDPGHYRMNGAECKKCGKKRSSCKTCDKKKDGGAKMSPYADGMGCGRKDVGDAINEILIREDKPCGQSHIPDNAKCTKSTTSTRRPSKKSGGFNLNKTLQYGVGLAAAAGIVASSNALEEAQKDKNRRKERINNFNFAREESNRLTSHAKQNYTNAIEYSNTISDPSIRARSQKLALQELKEKRLQSKMLRTEIKARIRSAKKSFPKSKARKRAAKTTKYEFRIPS